jgi:hypothetical protein
MNILYYIAFDFSETEKGPIFDFAKVGTLRVGQDGHDRTVKALMETPDKYGDQVRISFYEDNSYEFVRNIYRKFWADKKSVSELIADVETNLKNND